ncbi:hypothetical protein GZ22_02250 [Terribacillus saccharophilus]|uniref:Uncharacterized protein n=1 Tax=Terribacillus saccharophilus TaxID=361277 RepID=A0A075LGQ7_9BACI|nr:hypothetical protein [Terribacillus goriensis]AIF65584.1 hypothetical protein GZ22_02250 [Terribacillus goriensis]
MIILLDVFSILMLSSISGSYSEDDTQHNIENLKKTDWFQQYLKQQPYRDLLISDKDVRKVIGRLNNKKLAKNPQREAYQRIVTKALQQKFFVSQ